MRKRRSDAHSRASRSRWHAPGGRHATSMRPRGTALACTVRAWWTASRCMSAPHAKAAQRVLRGTLSMYANGRAWRRGWLPRARNASRANERGAHAGRMVLAALLQGGCRRFTCRRVNQHVAYHAHTAIRIDGVCRQARRNNVTPHARGSRHNAARQGRRCWLSARMQECVHVLHVATPQRTRAIGTHTPPRPAHCRHAEHGARCTPRYNDRMLESVCMNGAALARAFCVPPRMTSGSED